MSVQGHPAWLLASDAGALEPSQPLAGVRFSPGEERKLFGQDGRRPFAGPAGDAPDPLTDGGHPGGVLVDGRLVGAWGRRGGRVDIKLARALPPEARVAVEAEAMSFPIPGVEMSVRVTECSAGW